MPDMDARVLSALETLAARLGDVTDRLEKLETAAPAVSFGGSSSGGAASAPAPAGNASVSEWARIIDNEVAAFIKAATAVGGDALVAANNALAAFKQCATLIDMASQCSKPADLQAALAPLSTAIGVVSSQQKPRDRKDPQFMFIDMVQGAIGALCFVAADAEATATIDNNVEIMRFTGDKILMTYRRKEGCESYIAFENAYTAIWKAVLAYVKEHHPVGLKWQQGGIPTSQYTGGAAPAAANTTAPAPAPSPARAPAKAPARAAAKPAAAKKVHAEVNERVGFDQVKLAYCKGTRQAKENRRIVVDDKKDAVTIMDCEFCNIEIVGMPKSLLVTGCNKYYIGVAGCLTCINIDNSTGGSMDLTGVARTMQVEKCSDLDLTLKCKEAYGCNFVTSNVSGFNVYLEKEGIEGTELVSLAIPTQFESMLSFESGKPSLATQTMDMGFE